VTRLTTGDIKDIAAELPAYESSLVEKTGCSLRQLACRAMEVIEKDVQASMEHTLVGVIPMTSGGGVLENFCGTVARIVTHIGCRAFVTRGMDASGIAEAVEKKADILMFADEDRFVALDMQQRKIVDNTDATGRGFVTGLHLMAGCLNDKKVLVLGCGPVGQSAVKALLKTGCRISVYDIEPAAYDPLSAEFKNDTDVEIQFLCNLDQALHQHDLVVDASPAGGFILARHIKPQTIVSAPGMPLGLDRSALEAVGDRLLHDPLQIGVATMVVGALARTFHET
jgi:3-methylornithyl-N6-L-lysine dehydrogenase